MCKLQTENHVCDAVRANSLQQTRPGKQTAPTHLNLATKVFRGKHTKNIIKRWIEEVSITGSCSLTVHTAAVLPLFLPFRMASSPS